MATPRIFLQWKTYPWPIWEAFSRLRFQRNNLPAFNEGCNPNGAQNWIREIEKIFWVMAVRRGKKFCTPEQNQKAEQGTNPNTLKRDKQIQKYLHISQWISRNERNGKHPTRKELKNQDSHENNTVRAIIKIICVFKIRSHIYIIWG